MPVLVLNQQLTSSLLGPTRFNEDFTRAESSTAAGFENEPLAGIKGDLDIGLVEVYGLKRPT